MECDGKIGRWCLECVDDGGAELDRAHLPIGWVVTCQLPARRLLSPNFFAPPTLITLPIV